jgi:eukaryotic-like serine/threonine-protein kinase
LRTPTDLIIQDISASGRVLLQSVRFQIEMGLKRASDERSQDLETDVDLGAMTPDGQWLVYNRFQNTDYQAYVRKLSGTDAVQVGNGYGGGINWDASLIAAAQNSQLNKIFLYPTGPGEMRAIDLGGLKCAFGTWENDFSFTRDGRFAVFSAFDNKDEIRDYMLDMSTGKFRAVTPAGTRSGKLSPDGTRIATMDIAAQKYVLVDVASGKVSDIPGLEKDDEVVMWSMDGKTVTVWNQQLPARVSLLDVTTGKRQFVQTVEPLAMLGSMYARLVASGDGKTAAYRVRRGLYTVYIANGLH